MKRNKIKGSLLIKKENQASINCYVHIMGLLVSLNEVFFFVFF